MQRITGGGVCELVQITDTARWHDHDQRAFMEEPGRHHAWPVPARLEHRAGAVTGDEVEVEVETDAEPRVVAEPADFTRALDADPAARAAYDRLS